jgi:putative flavoprotein involved in K+ transport
VGIHIGIALEDLVRAGIERVPPVTEVNNGKPVLEDGCVMDVANVIWSTGFTRDYRWIKLPIFDAKGDLIHHRGVVLGEPGLYFVGLPYQSSLLSGLVAGADADAKYIVKQITARLTGLARGAEAGNLSKQASSTS